MLHRKNKNLRLVRESEESVDKLADEIMTELKSEGNSVEELEAQVRERRLCFRRRTVIIVAVAAIAAAALFLLVNLQTYTKARVSDTYKIRGVSDSNYEEFAGGVLKYSRDGVSYLNRKGEEQWNQPCQIKNPFVDVNEVSAVVADKGGNDIMIFQREGLKGEIKTTLPIEKISVSEQGIVSVIVKNEFDPSIICYDAAGNVLVELQASFEGEGYPVDVAISGDAEVMQVVYLCMKDTVVSSKVSYYNIIIRNFGAHNRILHAQIYNLHHLCVPGDRYINRIPFSFKRSLQFHQHISGSIIADDARIKFIFHDYTDNPLFRYRYLFNRQCCLDFSFQSFSLENHNIIAAFVCNNSRYFIYIYKWIFYLTRLIPLFLSFSIQIRDPVSAVFQHSPCKFFIITVRDASNLISIRYSRFRICLKIH